MLFFMTVQQTAPSQMAFLEILSFTSKAEKGINRESSKSTLSYQSFSNQDVFRSDPLYPELANVLSCPSGRDTGLTSVCNQQ